MKYAVIMIPLLLLSGPAHAEWVKIDEQVTQYVDPDTISRKGDLVKMWILADFKSSAGFDWSIKQQREFDCAKDSHRHLATLTFSGHMGKGRVMGSDRDISEWYSVEPGTMQQTLWKVACGKQ